MVKGTRNLRLSSKVNDIEIQYKLLTKYPNPNNHP